MTRTWASKSVIGSGASCFETSSLCMRERIGPVAAHQVLVARFSFALPIQQGEYSVTVGFANGGVGEADYAESLLFLHGVKTFHVYKNRQGIIWSGVVNLFPRAAFHEGGHGTLPDGSHARGTGGEGRVANRRLSRANGGGQGVYRRRTPGRTAPIMRSIPTRRIRSA